MLSVNINVRRAATFGVRKMKEQQMKAWINGASYEELLKKAKVDPSWFEGEIGDYYFAVLSLKRAQVLRSKAIGWD